MKPSAAAVLLIGAVLAAYSNSLHGPFVFDDVDAIVRNPTIRHLASLEIFSPPSGLTVSGRPVVNVSLALNHAVGGTAVLGYHAVNLAIHILAALALFGLVRRTLSTLNFQSSTGVALATALLWALHPLQTESVTYVVQRAESLMGLFYLLTLYCFARSLDSPAPRAWQIACVGACALGMATKEVMVSAPLAVLLYDRTFSSGRFAAAWRRRPRFYGALAATWLPLALLVSHAGDRAGTAGFSGRIAPWEYALTQCRALVHYLSLALWPHPLVFDYGPYAPSHALEIFPFVLLSILLLAAVVFLWRRQPAAGFAAAIFFLTLAPTSSIVPVETEPMAEHRLYLPLAALAALAVTGVFTVAKNRALPGLTAAALAGAGLTFQRNEIYRTERSLWTTTAAAAPENPRAHYSLAVALLATGEPAPAETHFKAALALRPDYVAAHHGLAGLLAEHARAPEATTEYQAILRSHPDDFVALQALGALAFQAGDLRAAAAHFENALRARPGSAPAHNNLGCVLYELGDFAGARRHEETALQLQPGYAEAHFNLGNALFRQSQPAAARDHYERALALVPDYAEAHAHLGVVLQNLGDRATAIQHYREALRLRPDFAFVRDNLATLGEH